MTRNVFVYVSSGEGLCANDYGEDWAPPTAMPHSPESCGADQGRAQA
ncbi:hypothetical protein RKE25_12495 [Dyella sp. BiH032]|nr:hypothetical protein [Dyella sp. BiH032]WNL44247.1 hypothetical protein RKE25_12495 [Dyella sp. BiH032]